MAYYEDDLLPLSALQHLLFCERQCALIHIERAWVENRYTAEGRIMHERVDIPHNCLLSFLYTLLVHDVRSALEAVGLDPQVEFLHRDRPGRPSLALDMMEEFRPFLADRLALSLINLAQVNQKGFSCTETGAVLINDETRKTLLVTYQQRKQDEIYHPFLNEKVTIGVLFHVQALLLARFLRGDLDGYPPFVWR